jgi:hypothetical protein
MPTQPYLAVQFNTATNLLDTTPTFAPNLVYPYTPPIGQTLTSSGTITNGSLVSLIDVAGNIEATLANANASCSQTVAPAHGFVLASTNDGQPVTVFLAGLVQQAIPGASASSVGALVYLSDQTPGAMSLVAPLPNKVWTPTTHYNIGDQIVDGNGNWETVTIAGNSGATEPPATPPGGGGAWSVVCNGLTPDGGVTWQMSPPHLEQVVGTIVYFNATTSQCTVNFQFLANIGDVSSVGLAMPSDFTVGGSPIVTAGTIQVQWLPQAANLVHAGPASGSAAIPTWRNLVAADFGPSILASTFLAGPATPGPVGPASFRLIVVTDLFGGTGATAYTFLRGDGSWAVPMTLQVGGTTFSGQAIDTINFVSGSGVGIVDSGSGMLTLSNTLVTASVPANYAYLGPTSGPNAPPSFRAIITADLSGILLGVPQGGTGAGTFTQNGVLYGNSTSPILATAQGTTNSVLTANGGAPSFSSTPTVTSLTTTGVIMVGTLISSYNGIATVANGVPAIYGAINLIGQTGNTSPTPLVASASAGLWLITVYTIVSQAATISSTLPDTEVIYTDQDSGATITVPLTASSSVNTTSTFAQATFVVNATAASAIQIAIGQNTPYASSGATPMQFSYRARAEFLG